MQIPATDLLSRDTFLNGHICVWQYKKGYRFSIDAVLLASFYRYSPEDYVVDMGCGSGIISLLLAYWYPHLCLTGVEIQPELAWVARKNVDENHFKERMNIVCADITTMQKSDFFRTPTHLMINPPFYAVGTGRQNPNVQQLIARHEVSLRMEQIIQTADGLLDEGGHFLCIYPAERWEELQKELLKNEFYISRVGKIYSKQEEAMKLVLVEAVKKMPVPKMTESEIVLYTNEGEYTNEIQAIFQGGVPNLG